MERKHREELRSKSSTPMDDARTMSCCCFMASPCPRTSTTSWSCLAKEKKSFIFLLVLCGSGFLGNDIKSEGTSNVDSNDEYNLLPPNGLWGGCIKSRVSPYIYIYISGVEICKAKVAGARSCNDVLDSTGSIVDVWLHGVDSKSQAEGSCPRPNC